MVIEVRPGVLYGHRAEKTGDRVAVVKKKAQAQTRGNVVFPMAGWMSMVKKHTPMKNRAKDICNRSGRTDAIPKTCQVSSPEWRNLRIRSCACGEAVAKAMYPLSHCFTRIAKEAVARLMTRLANHSTLTRMAVVEG